jgi:shikimate dehydrogenase
MFDGVGFVRGAERKGERIRGRRVALFGAGGAGSAIACALAGASVASIDVIDVDRPKAEALVRRLASAFPRCPVAAAGGVRTGVDLVVNASPVGMRPGDGLPGELPSLDAGTLVGDVVIADAPTPIIRHAMRCGCRWVDGRDMHGGQVDALMTFFSPSRPPG